MAYICLIDNKMDPVNVVQRYFNFIWPSRHHPFQTNICLNILITFLLSLPPSLPSLHLTPPPWKRLWEHNTGVCVFPRQIMSHRGLPKLKLYGFPYLLEQDATKLCPLSCLVCQPCNTFPQHWLNNVTRWLSENIKRQLLINRKLWGILPSLYTRVGYFTQQVRESSASRDLLDNMSVFKYLCSKQRSTK